MKINFTMEQLNNISNTTRLINNNKKECLIKNNYQDL